MVKRKTYDNSIYRLIISNLLGYGTFPVLPKGTKRALHVSPALDQLKEHVLDYLLQQQSKRTVKPINWSIAWQTHPASGLPHLDILIVFQKNVQIYHGGFDYLIKDLKVPQLPQSQTFTPGHVWVTPYSSKKLNRAILEYGQKQDPTPVTNLTLETREDIVRVSKVKDNPYRSLQLQMLKDPLNFNLEQYVRENDLFQYISSWTSIKTKLRDSQLAAANLQLKHKRGFRFIDRALIQACLSPEELVTYDSWSGYQTIVGYLNQVVTFGYKRPLKTLNLLITGPPNTGKTSLFETDLARSHVSVQDFCSVYPMGTRTWWPNYKPQVFALIYWNEAKLTSYSYDTILKVLEGTKVDLPQKGSSVLKYDNPLVVMTSNMTLEQLIQQKFSYNSDYVQLARENLAVRVQNVVIPPGLNLFILQKLLLPS